MTLAVGTRLGPYELGSPVGAGGMGEVYRAKDTRLERTVAVKVLPPHLSSSAESRQRFEREAKTISQLSHPHICALYDVGNQDGVEFLVMEYLEGETLSDRLLKGALPFEQVLRYGIEMADALDKAHRHGIVHRDLKPGNVMITKSRVKLLDFGLAKAVAPAGRTSGASLTALPTQAGTDLTAEGTILGTFQYMAPEQLEGKDADARTDIFAFGAVLYEMATGRKAFSGKSQASLISSIMGSEPPAISSLAPMTPPAFDRVVRTCLAKDPDDRWQTAHDVMLELKWVAEGGSAVGLPAPIVARRRSRERILWGVAGLAAGAILAGVAAAILLRRSAPPPRRGVGFALTFSAKQPFADGPYQSFALSPDGSRIVYAGGSGRQRRLYVRAMDRIVATPVPGTEEGSHPFFSPDGQSIAFLAEGKLKKLTFGGGAPVVLYNRHSTLGGSWAPDDTILFTPDFTGGIWRISTRGGEAARVVAPDPARKERAYILPSFLPDGKSALFTIWTGGSFDEAKIGLLDLATGKHRIVLEGGTNARYSGTGHVFFGRGGAIHAVPFDLKALAVTGPPVAILEGAMSDALNGNVFFDFSREGSLAYLPGTVRIPEFDLIAVDRKGAAQTITGGRPYAEPNVSPEGKRVAVTIQTSTFDIWIYDLDRGTLSRLSFGGDDSQPVWSPDGKRVAYSSSRAGVPNLFWRYADVSGPEERLATADHPQFPSCFTPDGRALVFVDVDRKTREDIWVLPLDGSRKPVAFLRTPFREGRAALSPDGRWIAYASDESGRGEIYVQPYPGPGGRIQISPDGGDFPLWSPGGRELYYRNQEKFLAASIQTEPSFSASKPTVLFEGKYGEGWDVAPDGKRFYTTREKQVDHATWQIHILLGWLEDVRRRLPAPKRS